MSAANSRPSSKVKIREIIAENRQLNEEIRRRDRAFEEVLRVWEQFLIAEQRVDSRSARHQVNEDLINFLRGVMPVTEKIKERVEEARQEAEEARQEVHQQSIRAFFRNILKRAKEEKAQKKGKVDAS